MTDHNGYDNHPELLLAGSDRPRPLPQALRARLEEALAEVAARPLSADVRGRLEDSLTRPQRSAAEKAAKWRGFALVAGAVAAIAAVVGVVVPGLVHSPNVTNSASNSPSRLYVRAPEAAKPHGPVRTGVTAKSAVPPATPTTQPKPRGFAPAQPGAEPSVKRASTVPPKTAPTHLGAPAASMAISVQKVSPERGPVAGGNWVALVGPGIGRATGVLFGASPARAVKHVSQTELRALAPAHQAGTIYVTVRGPGGTSSLPGVARYTFVTP